MTWEYLFIQIGMMAMAITGVLAGLRRSMDLMGVMMIGLVTALGGGTIRDVLLDVPVFWLYDFNYVWVSIIATVITFFFRRHLKERFQLFLYLDGIGLALFCIITMDKVLALGHYWGVVVIMSMITGVGGGILRDALTDQPTLMVRKELYATPVLAGSLFYLVILKLFPGIPAIDRIIGILFIISFRSAAIHWGLSYPSWLTYKTND